MTDRENDLLSNLRGNVSNNTQSSIMFLLSSLLETHVRRYYKLSCEAILEVDQCSDSRDSLISADGIPDISFGKRFFVFISVQCICARRHSGLWALGSDDGFETAEQGVTSD
jgi:hypothetical protein